MEPSFFGSTARQGVFFTSNKIIFFILKNYLLTGIRGAAVGLVRTGIITRGAAVGPVRTGISTRGAGVGLVHTGIRGAAVRLTHTGIRGAAQGCHSWGPNAVS